MRGKLCQLVMGQTILSRKLLKIVTDPRMGLVFLDKTHPCETSKV